MFLIGSTDGKYHVLAPNYTKEVSSAEYLSLAGLGFPHAEKQNPLVVIAHMQAMGTWK